MRSRDNEMEGSFQERGERRGRRGGHPGRSAEGHGKGRPSEGRGGRGGGGGRRGPGARGRGGRRHGDIRRLLLAGLVEGSAHGYELMKRLEERSEGRWRPSPGSVYPMLQQLEDEGLVTGSASSGRKTYDLTEAGRAEADPAALDALAAETEEESGVDLRAELEQLHLAVRQLRSVGTAEQAEEVAEVLRQARKAVYRLLADS